MNFEEYVDRAPDFGQEMPPVPIVPDVDGGYLLS